MYLVFKSAEKRRGCKSLSGAEKRKRNLHLKSLDKVWRKTAGKEMSARHRNARSQQQEVLRGTQVRHSF